MSGRNDLDRWHLKEPFTHKNTETCSAICPYWLPTQWNHINSICEAQSIKREQTSLLLWILHKPQCGQLSLEPPLMSGLRPSARNTTTTQPPSDATHSSVTWGSAPTPAGAPDLGCRGYNDKDTDCINGSATVIIRTVIWSGLEKYCDFRFKQVLLQH